MNARLMKVVLLDSSGERFQMSELNHNRGYGRAIGVPILFGLAYFFLAELGQLLSFPGYFASFWPPSGLYVAVLISAHYRRWPALMAAAVLANHASNFIGNNATFWVSLGFALANTV